MSDETAAGLSGLARTLANADPDCADTDAVYVAVESRSDIYHVEPDCVNGPDADHRDQRPQGALVAAGYRACRTCGQREGVEADD